jgi:CRISPR-associated endonuclease/helicase Cas3
VTLPEDFETPRTWESLADELKKFRSVMCVVNSRQHAYDLHKLMPKGTFHLSALMCGQHRTEVISTIKKRLLAGKPVRLISTQLVETGVDVDFLNVYRAMAGLDSLCQASGRCNREGKADAGNFVVFIPPEKPKIDHLRQAYDITVDLLRKHSLGDPFSAAMFENYYRNVYWHKGGSIDNPDGNLDRKGINALLRNNKTIDIGFSEAARRFQIINEIHVNVVVPWKAKGKAIVDQLLDCAATVPPHYPRWLYRKAQRYTVGVPENHVKELSEKGILKEINKDLWTTARGYDNITGLGNTIYSREL